MNKPVVAFFLAVLVGLLANPAFAAGTGSGGTGGQGSGSTGGHGGHGCGHGR